MLTRWLISQHRRPVQLSFLIDPLLPCPILAVGPANAFRQINVAMIGTTVKTWATKRIAVSVEFWESLVVVHHLSSHIIFAQYYCRNYILTHVVRCCIETECDGDKFLCHGLCLERIYVCDGLQNCLDNSDEDPWLCKRNRTGKLEEGFLRCAWKGPNSKLNATQLLAFHTTLGISFELSTLF